VDEIFVQGVATSDQAERQQLYWEAAEIMNEELPYIALYSPQNVIAYNNGLHITPGNSYAYITWDIENWALAGN
jgi:peptide/nickel transport system substrate-binding protein